MSRIVPRDWLEWAWAVCIALNVGVGVGAVTVGEWWRAVDAVTISILFALLVRFRRLAKYWEAEATVPPGPHIAGTLPDADTADTGLCMGWAIGPPEDHTTQLWRIRKRHGAWNVYRLRPVIRTYPDYGFLYPNREQWDLVTRFPTFAAAIRYTERNRQ
ncbi:hypothetical protein [Corynebacterium nuruki]|uniref:hypothetical protein n=1 Tax=Corynebacterium nuruki TaxID=1032851 RepID=UPI0039BFEAD6